MTESPANWRRSNGLSLSKAAGLAGITGKNPARSYQRWESGVGFPPLAVVAAIEKASRGAVTLASWIAIQPEVNAPKIASSGNTKRRAGGSSPGPNAQIPQSLQPVDASTHGAAVAGDVSSSANPDSRAGPKRSAVS